MNKKEIIYTFSFYFFVCSANGAYRDVVLNQGIVRGYDVDADDVISFYGIPYATAPVGEDRFKEPLPPRTWDGILNATGYNIVCYQGQEWDPAIFDAVKVFNCLIINIFVPKVMNKTNLPVLYHIHGGGYQGGHGNEMLPVGLVSRGMIVVNFNHRLGVHGFLCLNTEYAPGNAGFKDMVAALKWVKENIARFGGDPDNISMSGASSGSSAAEYMVLSRMSDGLLKRAMFESASGLGHSMFALKPVTLAERFANQYGVYTNENVDLLESFYRNLTDEKLNPIDSDIDFLPCVETHNLIGVEKFFLNTPTEIINSGYYEKIPIIMGFTHLEGLEFYPIFEENKILMEANLTDFVPNNIPINSEDYALELTERMRNMYFPTGEITLHGFIYYYSDIIFAYPLYVSARLHTKNGVPVYLYYFIYNGTVSLPYKSGPKDLVGPGHVAQSLYIYDYYVRSIYENMTAEDWRIRNKLRDIYYTFCKDGNPSESLGFEWLTVSVDTVNALFMDHEFYMSELSLGMRIEFWEQIYRHNYSRVTGSACVSSLSLFTGLVSVIIILLSFFEVIHL